MPTPFVPLYVVEHCHGRLSLYVTLPTSKHHVFLHDEAESEVLQELVESASLQLSFDHLSELDRVIFECNYSNRTTPVECEESIDTINRCSLAEVYLLFH